MNKLISIIIVVVIATTSIESTNALLFSPLLLKTNTWGVVSRRNTINSNTIKMPISSSTTPPIIQSDFSNDNDIMRFRHEVLSDIYEKSMNRAIGSSSQ